MTPLSFPNSDRLVMIWEKSPKGIDRNNVSPPNFTDYRKDASSFSAMAAFYEASANVTGLAEPEHLPSWTVTPELGQPLL